MSGLGKKWLARGSRGWAIIPGDCWLLGVGGLGENARGDEGLSAGGLSPAYGDSGFLG